MLQRSARSTFKGVVSTASRSQAAVSPSGSVWFIARAGLSSLSSSPRPSAAAVASSSSAWKAFTPARYVHTTDKGESEVHPTQQPSTSPDRQENAIRDPQASDATSGASRDAATVSQKDDKESQERFGTEEHTLMSEQEKEILHKLLDEFPGGQVAVQDVSGGCGTFFAISVESDKFKGLSKIKQHQLVNKILADEVKTWHGMQLKTMAMQA